VAGVRFRLRLGFGHAFGHAGRVEGLRDQTAGGGGAWFGLEAHRRTGQEVAHHLALFSRILSRHQSIQLGLYLHMIFLLFLEIKSEAISWIDN